MTQDRQDIECDVLIVGGGLGGTAAAIRAARTGYKVCLTEENHWLGGQCTAQGLSTLDEHKYIERFGGTALYGGFRNHIRAFYRKNYLLAEKADADPFFNPGAPLSGRLSFEPQAALSALLNMVLPEIEAQRLEIFYHARPLGAEIHSATIRTVTLEQSDYNRLLCFHPAYVLDATELGDLLPLVGAPFAMGAEARAETDEPHARAEGPAPHLIQPFTYPFVVDLCPGEDHTIPQPPDYEKNRDQQPYTLPHNQAPPDTFWSHHRILAADQFAPDQLTGDLIAINWPANAFKGAPLIGKAPQDWAEILQHAKNLSLGLLYWLQTEVPRQDGQGCGYPELRLRRDFLGTEDGLSQSPYIRESRRIKARKIVLEQEISAQYQQTARAALFADSVGLGFHPFDLLAAQGDPAFSGPTKPFQIPLGALISQQLDNLLTAGKNLGVTHLTSSCFRPHPTEWASGEAAGALACFCLGQQHRPATIHDTPDLLRSFQRELLRHGIPLYWYVDLPVEQPAFAATQLLALEDILSGHTGHLRFEPETLIEANQFQSLVQAVGLDQDIAGSEPRSRKDLACLIAESRFGLLA